MTKDHLKAREIEQDSLEQIFLDLDMSILATNRPDYELYCQNVRKEYSSYTDDQFRQGRLQFLTKIRDVDIFKSGVFTHLNKPARDNIDWEIQSLQETNDL